MNNIDLQKPIDKLYIRTSDEHYSIEGKTVNCYIEAFLCAKYKNGKTEYLAYTIGKGKATCSPEDKFDANVGMKLAAARAESNYCKRFSKLLDEALSSIGHYAYRMDMLLTECEGQVSHNEDYIKKIIEEL